MGVRACCLLEISGFAIPGDPVVLDWRKLDAFLDKLADLTGFTFVTREYYGTLPDAKHAVLTPAQLEPYNMKGGDLVLEELEFHGRARYMGSRSYLHLRTCHWAGNEYVGNRHAHSLVVEAENEKPYGAERVREIATEALQISALQAVLRTNKLLRGLKAEDAVACCTV